jgi:hypothetical protein
MPVVVPHAKGWAAYCDACSAEEEEYVYPCKVRPEVSAYWPPHILADAAEVERLRAEAEQKREDRANVILAMGLTITEADRERDEARAQAERWKADAERLVAENIHLTMALTSEQMRAEQAENTIQRVRDVHRKDRAGEWCDHDGFAWPCLTIRALDETP